MSSAEEAILQALSSSTSSEISDTYTWCASVSLDHKDVVGSMKSLLVDEYICTEDINTSFFTLTNEGETVLKYGSPEVIVYNALKESSNGLTVLEVQKAVGKDIAKIGMGNCMKNKWAKKDGERIIPTGDTAVSDTVQDILAKVSGGDCNPGDNKTMSMLKKRKLVQAVTRKSYTITRGPCYAPHRTKKAADLTKEMLDNNSWKSTLFKNYNFLTLGEKVGGGYLHPLLKVRAEFRTILMQMGFEEMPTNKWVESSFWNFDTLFQPQSHPARDAHDTFFILSPGKTLELPEDYYERVKEMHEQGGSGSVGYRYVFDRKEALKNLLRTHTTAVSSQMLYKLAQRPEGFKPVRYFSIDRVFRNETMDATHLCEFHQVEGFVADYNLSLGDLIGTIETFFKKIGITKLRFKPAFNPYTEPSMEIFGYHPDLKKWTEIGNSGMFRPEMLAPMGLPENVRVIAWGLSLERPTMIKYGIKNIRDLFGHKVEMGRTRTAPVCRFDDCS